MGACLDSVPAAGPSMTLRPAAGVHARATAAVPAAGSDPQPEVTPPAPAASSNRTGSRCDRHTPGTARLPLPDERHRTSRNEHSPPWRVDARARRAGRQGAYRPGPTWHRPGAGAHTVVSPDKTRRVAKAPKHQRRVVGRGRPSGMPARTHRTPYLPSHRAERPEPPVKALSPADLSTLGKALDGGEGTRGVVSLDGDWLRIAQPQAEERASRRGNPPRCRGSGPARSPVSSPPRRQGPVSATATCGPVPARPRS